MTATSALPEPDTRDLIMHLLLEEGPISATALAERLELTGAGVRRHLDALVEEGAAEPIDRSRYERRGPGRPAKLFRLTERGRGYFGHRYDALAIDALAEIRRLGGDAALAEFAAARVRTVLAGVTPAKSEDDVEVVVEEITAAFVAAGYTATAHRIGTGVQLCRHHCPIGAVAARFPELCEAEKRVLEEKLGTHVQDLSSIVSGHTACTTHVPLDFPRPPTARPPRSRPPTDVLVTDMNVVAQHDPGRIRS